MRFTALTPLVLMLPGYAALRALTGRDHGPDMAALYDALPAQRRGAWAPDSAGLAQTLIAALEAGDTIMVKGSLGSRMGFIVNAITDAFPPAPGATTSAAV